MIKFNNHEFDLTENMTIAQLVNSMKTMGIVDTTELLIIVNGKIVSSSVLNKRIVNDGDIIKAKYIFGGG